MKRASRSMKPLRTAFAALAGVSILSACSGENLFSLAGTVGQGSDAVVEITRPTAGLEVEVGDSVFVEASVQAPAGAGSVMFSGTYELEGTAAYVQEDRSGNGLVTLSLSNYLAAVPGQVPGSARIVVAVTERTGGRAADTVAVNIVAPIVTN